MITAITILPLIALACVVAAPVFDLLKYEIPDFLSIAIVAVAIIYGLVAPDFGWLSHLASTALVFAVGLLAFARGWMGGGDVKLLTAIATWTGLEGLLLQFVATALAGGGLALVLIAARSGLALAGVDAARVPRLLRRDAPLPYGVAIAIGTCWWALNDWPR
jgi:prepilin peptidase CpaA